MYKTDRFFLFFLVGKTARIQNNEFQASDNHVYVQLQRETGNPRTLTQGITFKESCEHYFLVCSSHKMRYRLRVL